MNILVKDIAIIGGGPGGYVAAIRAAQLGANVCIIEKDRIGGTCLNRGCIPTKALYKNAEVINTLNRADEFGIILDDYKIDVEKIQDRKVKIVDKLVMGIGQLLKANKVEIFEGSAAFIDKNTLNINLNSGDNIEITAKNIIIATGSKPSIPPILGADNEDVLNSDELLNFTSIPESLAIIGGGVIGMEFAGIFNELGSKVTVIEALPSILTSVDSDLTKRLTSMLKRKGMDIHVNTMVKSIESKEKLQIKAEGKKGEINIAADKVLIATGRYPSIDGLNLEGVGIQFDKKGIKVDSNYETNIAGIYAIGDVNGKNMLAHAASNQGVQVVEKILGKRELILNSPVPNCIFAFPEIACVGLKEDEAKLKGIEYNVSKFLFGANGKALTQGEGEGLIKVISRKQDNTILGVHIMGPNASDLISDGSIAITKGFTKEDLEDVIYAHPTLGEAFYEAVLGLTNEVTNSYK